MNTPTPITDLLYAVVGSDTHASAPRARNPGGEWDEWYALPRKWRRRIIGARWATAGGMEPDVFADKIRDHIAVDNPLTWFYRMTLLAIVERRAAHNRDVHQQLAYEHDQPTYYAYRTTICQQAGYRSVWQFRKAKGWE